MARVKGRTTRKVIKSLESQNEAFNEAKQNVEFRMKTRGGKNNLES